MYLRRKDSDFFFQMRILTMHVGDFCLTRSVCG